MSVIFCPISIKIGMCLEISVKMPHVSFHGNEAGGSRVLRGQTGMTKLMVAFRTCFVKVNIHKHWWYIKNSAIGRYIIRIAFAVEENWAWRWIIEFETLAAVSLWNTKSQFLRQTKDLYIFLLVMLSGSPLTWTSFIYCRIYTNLFNKGLAVSSVCIIHILVSGSCLKL